MATLVAGSELLIGPTDEDSGSLADPGQDDRGRPISRQLEAGPEGIRIYGKPAFLDFQATDPLCGDIPLQAFQAESECVGDREPAREGGARGAIGAEIGDLRVQFPAVDAYGDLVHEVGPNDGAVGFVEVGARRRDGYGGCGPGREGLPRGQQGGPPDGIGAEAAGPEDGLFAGAGLRDEFGLAFRRYTIVRNAGRDLDADVLRYGKEAWEREDDDRPSCVKGP